MKEYKEYTAFDPSLVNPLDGYVSSLENGEVPGWVLRPVVSGKTVQTLLGARAYDLEFGVPKCLPEGIEQVTRPPAPHDYTITRQKYLGLHQALTALRDDDEFTTVRFTLNPKNDLYTESYLSTVPPEIIERLANIQETREWQRTLSESHVDFKKWDLTYALNARGEIQNVSIQAEFR